MVAGISAMVIEDNDDLRYLVRIVMEVADVPIDLVAEARSGDDALEAWREHRPDVVILDFRLPGMDGLEIAQQILEHEPEQAIILFSAFLDEPTIRRAEKIGVRSCVSKDEIRRLPDLVVEHGTK